jgi:hypothetical protein
VARLAQEQAALRAVNTNLLIDHKAEFGYGAHGPVFATRNGRRNTVDNACTRPVRSAGHDLRSLRQLTGSSGAAALAKYPGTVALRCAGESAPLARRVDDCAIRCIALPSLRCWFALGHYRSCCPLR